MPFEKGRQKTGGRTKTTPLRRSSKFVDQLKAGGFDFVREYASALKAIKEVAFSTDANNTPEAIKAAAGRIFELKFYYGELKSLLPYMAPRLREVDVAIGDEPEVPATPTKPATDEELLKVMGHGTATADQPRASDPSPVGAGSAPVQVPIRTEEDLLNVVGEQEEDA